ncbi:hypothetical protein GCM10023192_79660 [Amycolatopsis samaneae]
MTVIASRLTVTGDVLLGAGAVMAIAEPSGPGFNFGAAGSLFFGQCAAGAGLLLGVVAALAWLRGRRGDRQPPAQLLARERRLRGLTAAAVGLMTIGAAVLGAGPLFVQKAPGSGFNDVIPVFLAGLGVSVAGLLVGTLPALHWLSKRWAEVDR